MNIIRTTAVELSTIPAIAYKQKLASGGAGIKLFRLDKDASAVFTLNRGTGDSVAYGAYDADLFPDEAVLEVQELTVGLPYSSRGKLKVAVVPDGPKAEDEVAATETDKTDMVDSPEYQALLERYTNEKGKINYTLMNKDFIQFASRSKIVASMVADRAKVEDILTCIVKTRVALLAGKKETLGDQDIAALIETLDEIDPRSAFKELSLYIKRLLSKNK